MENIAEVWHGVNRKAPRRVSIEDHIKLYIGEQQTFFRVAAEQHRHPGSWPLEKERAPRAVALTPVTASRGPDQSANLTKRENSQQMFSVQERWPEKPAVRRQWSRGCGRMLAVVAATWS